MKHIRILCLVLAVSVLSLTGCMDVKDISEDQSDLVAEYAAGVLLRYSDHYERRLITKDQIDKQQEEGKATPTPEATESATASPMTTSATSASDADGGSEPTDAPAVSLDELYHLDGVKVSYDSYRFSKKYGDQIKADKGQTLLIVSFRLKNESGKKKKVSLMDRTGIEYKLDVDGEQYSPQISILANGGMNYFEDTIEKGKSEKAVLIFRMDQGKKSASSIHLTITEGNENASVEIK